MRAHRSIVRFLIVNFCYYYALALGVTAIRFDFDKHEIHSSKLLSVYAACFNVIIVALMPYVLVRCTLDAVYDYGGSALMRWTFIGSTGIHFVIIVLTILTRPGRERRFIDVAREFFAIDERYFDRLPPHAKLDRRFNFVYCAKFCTMCARVATTVMTTTQMTYTVDAEKLFFAVYFSNVQNFIHGLVFHYFGTLWHACKRFEIINGQLLELHRRLLEQEQHREEYYQPRRERASTQLREMAHLHWRLTNLMLGLSDGYKFQIMAVLLTYVIYNISYGYYAVLLANGTLQTSSASPSSFIGFGVVLYSVLLADLYLFYWACAATTNAYASTSYILRGFHQIPRKSVAFERSCEAFSLQLMQRKLNISMGGMFSLTLQTLLSLWTYILRHTLILVQFEYEFREAKRQQLIIQNINCTDF